MTKNRHVGTLQKWWEFCTLSKCAQKIFFGKILCSTHQKKCFYKLLGSFWKIEFLMENRQPRTLQKWWKFCTISNVLRIFFFWQNSLFHSSKEVFLQTFRQFLENWIFDGKSTAADLTKIVKTLYSLKISLENIFGKNYLFHSSKEAFLQNFRQFLKIEFLMETRQTGPHKNGENFVLSQHMLRIFFGGKILCSTHQKKCFYKILGSFLENWTFDQKSTRADLTKMLRILYSLKMCLENIFWQNPLFYSSKEAFLQNFNSFRKIEFLMETRQPLTLENGKNIVLSQNVLRKYFLAKSFVQLIKRTVSSKF